MCPCPWGGPEDGLPAKVQDLGQATASKSSATTHGCTVHRLHALLNGCHAACTHACWDSARLRWRISEVQDLSAMHWVAHTLVRNKHGMYSVLAQSV